MTGPSYLNTGSPGAPKFPYVTTCSVRGGPVD